MLPYLDQAIMDIKNRITGEVFFVKDTVVDWVDIFTRPIYRHIIIESLQYCQNEYSDESVQPFWTKVYNCGVEKLSLKSNDFLFLFSHRFAF